MNDRADHRQASRQYVFAMLRELATLLSRCGDKVTSAEIMMVLLDARDREKQEKLSVPPDRS